MNFIYSSLLPIQHSSFQERILPSDTFFRLKITLMATAILCSLTLTLALAMSIYFFNRKSTPLNHQPTDILDKIEILTKENLSPKKEAPVETSIEIKPLSLPHSNGPEREDKDLLLSAETQKSAAILPDNSTPVNKIKLSIKIPVKGELQQLDVQEDDTILSLKQLLQNKLGISSGSFASRAGLLENLEENKTLAEYGISSNPVLYHVKNPSAYYDSKYGCNCDYYFKTLTGKCVYICAEGSDSIFNLKQKLQDKEGWTPDAVKLTYDGTLLQDHLTLNDYHIPGRSIFHVHMNLSGD